MDARKKGKIEFIRLVPEFSLTHCVSTEVIWPDIGLQPVTTIWKWFFFSHCRQAYGKKQQRCTVIETAARIAAFAFNNCSLLSLFAFRCGMRG